ncbi:MAG: ribonuclease HII [Actinobacteria bacterium]|nr:ribonuclease HII [Actinomycetota bacterium]
MKTGDEMQIDLELEAAGLSVESLQKLVCGGDEPDLMMLSNLARSPRKIVRDIAYLFMTRGGGPAENEETLKNGIPAISGGADEVGRGALAGPITAACVVLKEGSKIDGIGDSKSLTRSKREELYKTISSQAACISVTFVDQGVIDSRGLQYANIKALRDSINSLDSVSDYVICDHFSIPDTKVSTYGIAKADAIFQSVAAASIIAKVERDRVMEHLDDYFPCYGFCRNKGYGTKEHMDAISRYGPCVIHRLSFKGVGFTEKQTLWGQGLAG